MSDHDEDCDCDECVAPSTLADLPMYIRLSPQTYDEYEALQKQLATSESIADEAKKLLYDAEARCARLEATIQQAYNHLQSLPELNMKNYTEEQASELNTGVCDVICDIEMAREAAAKEGTK